MNPADHVSSWKFSRLAFVSFLACVLSFTLTAACAETADTPRYNSRVWRIDDGLPDNVVDALAQTPDGYLWVGTRLGLMRFDGISFTRLESKSIPELKNAGVMGLCVDHQGALWIATAADGLICLKGGVLSQFRTTNGLSGNSASAVCEAADGSIWAGTANGASHYKDGKFTNYTVKDGLGSNAVNSIYAEADGTVWIATALGLNYCKDSGTKTLSTFEAPGRNTIRAVCRDKSGRLWIGSTNGIILCDQHETNFYAAGQGLSDRFISSLREDRNGHLWVGTFSGLNCFCNDSRRFESEPNSLGRPYDKVNDIFEDREGNLWIGSREGLIRLSPKYFTTYNRQQGLAHDNTMSVLEDRNGNIWFGTWGSGLIRLQNGKVTVFNTETGFPSDLILGLCEARDGSLWIGTDYTEGLLRMKDGKWTQYTEKDGLIGTVVRVIHEDKGGTLWVGTGSGLSCFKDGKFTNHHLSDNPPYQDVVRAICEDSAGNVWVGTEGGLSRWKDGRMMTNFNTTNGLLDDSILSLYEDKEHVLWIGTANAGLTRYRDGRFTTYTSEQGLFSDRILSVLEDEHGWLWMSSQRGIFRVLKADLHRLDRQEIKTLRCVSYGKDDGMESMVFNAVAQPSGLRSRAGLLWFPTTKGLVALASEPHVNTLEPKVCIEELLADRHRIETGLVPLGDDAVVEIPPGRGELEFHYTALSLAAPEKNRFAYKLEGVDPEWISGVSRRSATYYNINPGRYRFHVVACNNDGVWNETGAVLSFVLLPHFWQTWWFKAFIVLAGVLLVGGTVWYGSWRRLRQKLAWIEMQHSVEKDRARIARDIHDDLGSTLTQITLLSELTQREAAQPAQVQRHAAQIAQSTRDLVQSMDEIVWAVNPRNDNLPRLAGYLFQYAEKHFAVTPLRCRFDSPEDLPELNLSAETRHHLFLAVKEALNNVARHAGATELWLRLREVDSALEISIEDNGRGFAADQPGDFGNGLENMKKRMEEIGGDFTLVTKPGVGTTIRLRLPLNG